METKYFTTTTERFRSDWNNKEVLLNAQYEKIAIIQLEWTEWKNLKEEWQRVLSSPAWKKYVKNLQGLRGFTQELDECETTQQVVQAVERLIGFCPGQKQRYRAVVIRLLIVAYRRELVLFPFGILAGRCRWLGTGVRLAQLIRNELEGHFQDLEPIAFSGRDRGMTRPRVGLLLTTSLRSCSDASTALAMRIWQIALPLLPPDGLRTAFVRSVLSQLFSQMQERIRTLHPGTATPWLTVAAYENGQGLKRYRGRDPSYEWLSAGQNRLEVWSEAFRRFLQTKKTKRLGHHHTKLIRAAEYLLQLPQEEIPLTINKLTRKYIIRRAESPSKTFSEFLVDKTTSQRVVKSTIQALGQMLEWCRDEGMLPDSWRNPVHESDLPVGRITQTGKTDKEILPLRLIREMKEIIVEDDFKWPRTLESDYFSIATPEPGGREQVWSPVRAVALLVLLMLPIRSIQVRLLDSGEGDEWRYDPESHGWVKNNLSTATAGRSEGVVGRSFDHEKNRYYSGFYINTNKTAAIATGADEGYFIPWENIELLAHLSRLAEWQSIYNPLSQPISRDELKDLELEPSEALRGQLPRYYFLFRDPANRARPPSEPVSKSRLDLMFQHTLIEAERRMRARGEDVRFVARNGGRKPHYAFSLHGLRASGITHLLQAGVPVPVLAEFVAGHATILMTLHYARFGPSYVTDVIDKAAEAAARGEPQEWAGYLAAMSAEDRRLHAVAHDHVALTRLADSSPGLWAIQLDGICPVGRALCNRGALEYPHGSVPGGARNCSRCRFFITGPVFLSGQVVAFNNAVFVASERIRELDRLRKHIQVLRAQEVSPRRLIGEQSKQEALELEIDEILTSIQMRYQLIERSRALLSSDACSTDPRFPLLTLGDQVAFDLVVEQTQTDFELIDFVAQAGQLFPDQTEPSARLRKGRIMDALLADNGVEPFLFSLPEDEALAAANQLTRFLQKRVGRKGLAGLVGGSETLASLGISQEFRAVVGDARAINFDRLTSAKKVSADITPSAWQNRTRAP